MDKARAVYEEMMKHDYCSQWMGLEPILVEEGHCILRMEVKKEMLNGYGILHGGIAFTFADSAFAFASNSYGRIAVSITGSMSYAQSAKEGDVLLAEANALHITHKTGEFEVILTSETSGEVYYRFHGMVYRKSQEVLG